MQEKIRKQETLKEYDSESYLAGIKSDLAQDYWCKQQERMYSEEEVYNLLEQAMKDAYDYQLEGHYNGDYKDLKKWFEQVKKK